MTTHTVTAVGSSVVDTGTAPDGEPHPHAATAGVEVHAVHTWTGTDGTQYVEVRVWATLVDHSQRDSRGNSGVEVALLDTHGVTDRHRQVAPIARALAAAMVPPDGTPDHVARLWEREKVALVALALGQCVDRTYS